MQLFVAAVGPLAISDAARSAVLAYMLVRDVVCDQIIVIGLREYYILLGLELIGSRVCVDGLR